MTRQLLWEEYQAQHSEALQYSAFCDRYREWLQNTVKPVLRFEHHAGVLGLSRPAVHDRERHSPTHGLC